ncbi:uncharacterized protein CLAFUR5_13995 [Fulvia fulva]|uniref:Uncharacterized protein n=1 Tax=Passalora fulva TaxID=5499 RepID=A0A9Q8PKQ4_PASFU|nr:uncharacterized protein CLAFUR5_13995 [Fulvia fulva]KAK4610927.1 hypothetical protein CLAFUR0_14168 [Fulvia fulva]UJO24285.1 hypothetical protein CLAFUR5_13995 [Fulvia fulva]
MASLPSTSSRTLPVTTTGEVVPARLTRTNQTDGHQVQLSHDTASAALMSPKSTSPPLRVFKDPASQGKEVLCSWTSKTGDMSRNGRKHQDGDGCKYFGTAHDIIARPLEDGDSKPASAPFSDKIRKLVEFHTDPSSPISKVAQFSDEVDIDPDSEEIIRRIGLQAAGDASLGADAVVLAQSAEGIWFIGKVVAVSKATDGSIQTLDVQYYHMVSEGTFASAACTPKQVKLMTPGMPCKATPKGKAVFPHVGYQAVHQYKSGMKRRIIHRDQDNGAQVEIKEETVETLGKKKAPQQNFTDADGNKVKGNEQDKKNHYRGRSIENGRRARRDLQTIAGQLTDEARADPLTQESKHEADSKTAFRSSYPVNLARMGYIVASYEEFESLTGLTPARITAWRREYVRVVRRHNGDKPRKKKNQADLSLKRGDNKLSGSGNARVLIPTTWPKLEYPEWSDVEDENDGADPQDASVTSATTTVTDPTASEGDTIVTTEQTDIVDEAAGTGVFAAKPRPSITTSTRTAADAKQQPTRSTKSTKRKAKTSTSDLDMGGNVSQTEAADSSQVVDAAARPSDPLPSTTSAGATTAEAQPAVTIKKTKRRAKAGHPTDDVSDAINSKPAGILSKAPQKQRGADTKRQKLDDDEYVPRGSKATSHEEVMRAREEMDGVPDMASKSIQQLREEGEYPFCHSCTVDTPLFESEFADGVCADCLEAINNGT